MFEVRPVTDRWPAYDLIDRSSGARARVVPGRGGIVTEWEWGGHQLLYLDRSTYEDGNQNVRGGIPILFPICGRLNGDAFELGGRVYHLPQHGLARRMPWQVQSTSVDGGAAVRLRLTSSDETRMQYPFDFELSFEYRLAGSSLQVTQTYLNHSDHPMPMYPGLHPYFAAPGKERTRIEVPATTCHDRTGESRDVRAPIDWGADEVNLFFTGLAADQASVVRSDGVRVTVGFSQAYQTLVFWTLSGRPFVCLEPCVAAGDRFASGEGLLWVAPGGSQTLTAQFTATVGNGTVNAK